MSIALEKPGAAPALSRSTRDGQEDDRPKEVFTFWKGRIGLFAILKAAGIASGDKVLVPGYTCAMVPAMVVHAGARCVYVDIDPFTFNCSPDDIAEAWGNERGPKPKALILQHTFGIAADVARITKWAKAQGVTVIEDCAHALATKYRDEEGKWRRVGKGGDAAFFSSQWSKPISTGLGGWVTLNNSRLTEYVRSFHANECASPSVVETSLLAAQVAFKGVAFHPSLYWIMAGAYRWVTRRGLVDGTVSDRELAGEMPRDFAKRMSAFQQWLLQRRLADKHWEDQRRRLRKVYDEELRRAGIAAFCDPAYADSVLLRYPVRVKNKEEVLDEARRRRVEIGEWFNHPIHPRECNSAVFQYRLGDCPQGECAARQVVNLPMHHGIDDGRARSTVQFLLKTASWVTN